VEQGDEAASDESVGSDDDGLHLQAFKREAYCESKYWR
jgi:hypothetical protein